MMMIGMAVVMISADINIHKMRDVVHPATHLILWRSSDPAFLRSATDARRRV
jgi:hypothetical protein